LKAHGALAQVIADAQQIVGLAEAARGVATRLALLRSARPISRRPQRPGAESEKAPKIARFAGVCCAPSTSGSSGSSS